MIKKSVPLFLSVLILTSIFSSAKFLVLSNAQDGSYTIKLVRTPLEVYSGQSALIFAYVKEVVEEVKLSVNVTLRLLKNDNIVQEFPVTAVEVPMVTFPRAKGWYIAAIPGLPAKTVVIKRLLMPDTTWKVTSSVSYKLIVDGIESASEGYEVTEGEIGRRLPPLVLASVCDVLEDPLLIEETLGLGPRGWKLDAYKTQKIIILTIDNEGVEDVSFEYSISGGAWSDLTVTTHPLMVFFDYLIDELNDAIQTINFIEPDLELQEIQSPIKIFEVDIPGQPAGSYVMFKAKTADTDGNEVTSPKGFYFVVNQASDTRILVVDPHVKLWLLQENLQQLTENFRKHIKYQIPNEILSNMIITNKIAEIIHNYGITPFHHWERLGKNYYIYVTWPNKAIADLLKSRAEGGFEPHIILLSNLSFGFNSTEAPITWSWDLRDLGVQNELIRYVKEKHAGLIATHGTLSDWVLWTGPNPSEHYKMECRGHVGESLEDVNLVNENTIAALLGMPQLVLWELLRDKVASALCANPETELLGLAVGSMPLQVPHVPFNGSMRLTPEAESLGWKVPKEFTIKIPTVYNEFGFNAYTQVGWQLAMPRAVAYAAWWKAKEDRPLAGRLYGKLSRLMENLTRRVYQHERVMEHLDSSLRYGLHNFYRSMITANISDSTFSLTVNLPELGKNFTFKINIGKAFHQLLQLLPTKVISVSKDRLAVIVVHDRYWDPDGYRSVYFSFEVEAADGEIAEQLLTQAVEWTRQWKHMDVTELLGNAVRVAKETARRFREAVDQAPGTIVLSKTLLLNEEGNSPITLTSEKGFLHLVIVHPTSDKVNVTVTGGGAAVVEVSTEDRVTTITVKVYAEESVEASVKADPDSSLNPAYTEVKFEETVTPSPTLLASSPTPMTTATPTPLPIPTPTPTPAPTPLPTPYILIEAAVAIVVIALVMILLKRRK